MVKLGLVMARTWKRRFLVPVKVGLVRFSEMKRWKLFWVKTGLVKVFVGLSLG